MKWTNSPNNPAGKIQVGRVNKALAELAREHHTKTEKSGIFGKKDGYDREYEGTVASYMLCGTNPTRDDVTVAQKKIGEQFNWTVTKDNANAVCQAIAAEFPALIAARPIIDKRKTQEASDSERTSNQENSQKMDAERQAKTTAENAKFIAHYGESAVPETVPEGMMPVTISLKFDNSDSMTDYFDRHASLGPDFLLGYVPKQSQTQSLARRLLERYPEFAKVGESIVDGKVVSGYTWHTENYSMGHGNYLDGTTFELPADLQGLRQRYGAGDVTRARWQVEFNSTGRFGSDKFLPLKGYPGVNASAQTTEGAAPITGAAAVVTLNQELNGVEIRFPGKPGPEVIADLKTNGFRWAFRSKCWYKRQSEFAIAAAHRIAGVNPGSAAVPAAPDDHDMRAEDQMAAACGL